MRGRRVVFSGPYELAVEGYDPDPVPPAGSVLVRCDRTLISPGTELALYTGTHVGLADPDNTFARYPFRPGYAGVGRVEATGEGVTGLAVGDRVFGSARHGTHAVLDAGAVYPVADGVPDEEVVFARMAGISLTAVIQSQPGLRSGTWVGVPVAVLGLGLVGNLAAQLLGLVGARVVGVDPVPGRLRRAAECGIEHLVSVPEDTDPGPAVRELLGPDGPQVVVEATGIPALVTPALRLAARYGQVVLLGSTRGTAEVDVYKDIHARGVTVVGAHASAAGSRVPDRDAVARYVLRLVERRVLRVEPLLTDVLPGAEAGPAYERLLHDKDNTLGVLLDWR